MYKLWVIEIMDSEFSKTSMCVFPLLDKLLTILNSKTLKNRKKDCDMYKLRLLEIMDSEYSKLYVCVFSLLAG